MLKPNLLCAGLILACIAPYLQAGPLLVSSINGNEVLAFDSTTGSPLGVFASGGGLSAPFGLAFGPDNNLYVAGNGNNAILRYNGVTGASMGTFASGGGLSGVIGMASRSEVFGTLGMRHFVRRVCGTPIPKVLRECSTISAERVSETSFGQDCQSPWQWQSAATRHEAFSTGTTSSPSGIFTMLRHGWIDISPRRPLHRPSETGTIWGQYQTSSTQNVVVVIHRFFPHRAAIADPSIAPLGRLGVNVSVVARA